MDLAQIPARGHPNVPSRAGCLHGTAWVLDGARGAQEPDDADSTAPRVDVSTLLMAVFATVLFLAAMVIPAGAHSLAQVLG